MQFDPSHLAALSAVLRHGGFEAAAHDLNITQSAVSQRIKALETRVGAPLVERGKPCTGTPLGLRIANHAEQVALLEAQLAGDLRRTQPKTRTRIPIALPADSLATWFLGALADLPDHLFDLVIDDQDHSADWLHRSEVLAAVTARPDAAPGCDTIALGTLPYVATASPAFIAHHFADGFTPQAFARAPMLRFNRKDRLQHGWMEMALGQRLTPPLHGLPSSEGFVQACRLGIGWGVNPVALVAGDLAAGRLVALCDGLCIDTPLYWQTIRLMEPALAPLTRAVRRAARMHLSVEGGSAPAQP